MKKYETIDDARAIWLTTSPTERQQISDFVKANATRPDFYFFLCRLRNFNSGKLFVSAGFRLEPPGILTAEFQTLLGIPVPPRKPTVEEPVRLRRGPQRIAGVNLDVIRNPPLPIPPRKLQPPSQPTKIPLPASVKKSVSGIPAAYRKVKFPKSTGG